MFNVRFFFRKQLEGAYSVERLFEDIRNHLPLDIKNDKKMSIFPSTGILNRLYNIVHACLNQSDVNHITGEVHFLSYLMRKKITVLTILDCVMMEKLSGFKRMIFWIFWLWLPEKRSGYITVISETTKIQLLKYLRCNPEKIRVLHCNVSPEFKKTPKEFGSPPRILQVGTFENKNLLRVISALRGIDCKLVIIGKIGKKEIDALEKNSIDFENHVNLKREELVQQYELSDILIFASTYEGFGLPIVEANAVGRPVITSNLSAMPEVAADAACLVDPYDVNSIRSGVLRVVEDSDYRERIISNGYKNAERFSVKVISEKYASLYREVFLTSGGNV